MKLRSKSALILLAASLGAACATAPVQEMSNARQAISAARSGGASTELQNAESLLKKAEEELAAGDYSQARINAAAAREAALKARSEKQPNL